MARQMLSCAVRLRKRRRQRPALLLAAHLPPGDPKALRAGFAHDYIYRTHPAGWTKADADRMFYELLVEDGVPKWRARLAYRGVAWFGGRAWKEGGKRI